MIKDQSGLLFHPDLIFLRLQKVIIIQIKSKVKNTVVADTNDALRGMCVHIESYLK